jgi:hypothetical protein
VLVVELVVEVDPAPCEGVDVGFEDVLVSETVVFGLGRSDVVSGSSAAVEASPAVDPLFVDVFVGAVVVGAVVEEIVVGVVLDAVVVVVAFAVPVVAATVLAAGTVATEGPSWAAPVVTVAPATRAILAEGAVAELPSIASGSASPRCGRSTNVGGGPNAAASAVEAGPGESQATRAMQAAAAAEAGAPRRATFLTVARRNTSVGTGVGR